MENVETTSPTPQAPAVSPSAAPEDSCSVRLSERDAAAVMAAADNPPSPSEAALRAAKWFLENHG
jgi:hypothetical protein